MHREYWHGEGAFASRMVGDRYWPVGCELLKAGISIPEADGTGLMFNNVTSVVGSTMFIRQDEADDVLRVKTFGPSSGLMGPDGADWAADSVFRWLEGYACADGEVGWALMSPVDAEDDADRAVLVIGESDGMPAVAVGLGGYGEVEFRPRIGKVGDYLPLAEASSRLNRWMGWEVRYAAVVPRFDRDFRRHLDEMDLGEQMYFAHVGEIHADFRHEPGGGVRVWPMDWTGLLDKECIGEASEAAAAHLRAFGERWAADNPGRAVPKMTGRVFALDGDWAKGESSGRSCYGLEMGDGVQVSADGRFGPWADPFRFADERERSTSRELQTM